MASDRLADESNFLDGPQSNFTDGPLSNFREGEPAPPTTAQLDKSTLSNFSKLFILQTFTHPLKNSLPLHPSSDILVCIGCVSVTRQSSLSAFLKGSVAAIPFIFLQLLPGKISENRVGFNFNITTLRLLFQSHKLSDQIHLSE
jgi:hypothetical protein